MLLNKFQSLPVLPLITVVFKLPDGSSSNIVSKGNSETANLGKSISLGICNLSFL